MITKGVLFEKFVGRDEELAVLLELREKAARQSAPSCVTITGTAGIGKSRLIREFSRRTSKLRGVALEIDCDAIATAPYAGIRALLDAAQFGGKTIDAIEGARKLINDRLAFGAEFDGDEASRVSHTLVNALQLLAARRGHVVVILEDAHECDVPTLKILAALVKLSRRHPIMLIATFREQTEWSLRSDAIAAIERSADYRVALDPLPIEAIAQSITSSLPTLTRSKAIAIAKRSEGNPFFAEELARATRDDGTIIDGPTLRAETIAPFAKLDSVQFDVVRAAATIAREFEIKLLYNIANVEEGVVEETLSLCKAAGLIKEIQVGLFSFSHALYRESLEMSLKPSEAKMLHDRVADELEKRDSRNARLFEIARHRWSGSDPVKAIDANEFAGDNAAKISAYAEAADCYERALELLPVESEKSLRIKQKAIDSYAMLGAFSRSLSLSTGVIERLEMLARVESALTLTTQAISWAAISGAIEIVDQLVHRARKACDALQSSSKKIELEIAVSQAATVQFNPLQALTVLQDICPLVGDCAPIVQIRYYNARGLAYHLFSDNKRAISDLETSLKIANAESYMRGQLIGTNNLCIVLLESGRAQFTVERLLSALERSRSMGWAYAEALIALTLMRSYLSIGRLIEARQLAHRALDLRCSHEQIQAEIEATAFQIANLTDDTRLTERVSIDVALELARASNSPIIFSNVTAIAARELLRCNVLGARQLLNSIWKGDRFLTFNRTIVDCVAEIGTPTQIEATRAILAKYIESDNEIDAAARLDLFEAKVAMNRNEPIEARRRSESALIAFKQLEMPLEVCACLEILGEIESAIDLFRQLAADGEVKRYSVRPARHTVIDDKLSGREEQVCRLLAEGLTSRDAAAKLGITARTVETHIANAYRKLGIRTRAEVAIYFRGLDGA